MPIEYITKRHAQAMGLLREEYYCFRCGCEVHGKAFMVNDDIYCMECGSFRYLVEVD